MYKHTYRNNSPPSPPLHHSRHAHSPQIHHSNNQHSQHPQHQHPQHHHSHPDYFEDSNSEIYIDQSYHDGGYYESPPPPPPPRISRSNNISNQEDLRGPSPRPITPATSIYNTGLHRPHTTTPSEYSSVSKSKNKNKGGVVIETMSAPNPCCPDSKGVCCILLLVNLGLLLVTLGFSVVLQLFEPPFVWYCGLLFLIVGFIALIASLLFCMRICRYSRWYNNYDSSNSSIHGGPNNNRGDGELYWTHHWQKRINLPGTTSRASSTQQHQEDNYGGPHHY